MGESTLVFGHRGYPAKFPENSLAGFTYAVDHGIEGLEFDVHLTRDQVPVIMHDEKINRTTNGKGYIRDYTLAQLRQFRLADGTTVPTLAEFLRVVAAQAVQLNLEFKTDKIQYPDIERLVLDQMHAAPLVYPVIYSSFHLPTIKRAQQLAPTERYCWLTDKRVSDPVGLVQREHLAGLHLSHYQADVPVTERIWTVDSVRQAKKLMTAHVAGIFTDDFETMMHLKQQLI